MKRLLIISPYFPPSNAADAQRVRMSLPFYNDFEWEAELVTVHPKYSEMVKDELSLNVVPKSLKIHYVQAFSKDVTGKIGLGSLALRSLWQYKKKVSSLLKGGRYDLILFSTTQYPICILGSYWKKKFGIPFVIDMQDPWHSTYYLDKPASQKPPKFWFSYRLNKYLEPLAMSRVDGLISVSQAYLNILEERYNRVSDVPKRVITFGYLQKDFEITRENFEQIQSSFVRSPGLIYLVYVGRGGYDMQPAIRMLFTAFKEFLKEDLELAKRFRFRFIGTSYAPKGTGISTISPIATELDINDCVEELTDRVGFYEGIKNLLVADGLIIPGSNDPGYTASKLYPYILAQKPLLALFNPLSSAYRIVNECKAGEAVDLSSADGIKQIKSFFSKFSGTAQQPGTDWNMFEQYSAKNMTLKQCELFDLVLAKQTPRCR